MEELYRLLGRGSFFWDNPSEGLGVGVAKGHNYFDLSKTGERIKTIDASCKENTATAKELEKVARREESLGHVETAREFYHRAVLFYEAAAWPIFDSDDPEYLWLNERLDECFDKVLAHSPYPAERDIHRDDKICCQRSFQPGKPGTSPLSHGRPFIQFRHRHE